MKKVLFAVAAVMMIAACAKEETPEQKVNKGALSFSATMEQQQDAAKSALVDGTQVSWNVGDEVCVYHWNDGTVTYAGFTAETAGTATTFTDNPEHKHGLEELTYGDIAIYPFHEGNTLANTLTNDHTVTFTTSVDQTYVPNSFPAGANVAVGIVTTVNDKPVVNFRNVFGVLKLSLTGDKKIKSIRIEDNEGKNLTGDFSVDLTNSASPVFTQTGGSDYILLNCGEEGVQLNISTPTDFYIVVPTGAFEHGFTATVTPVETKYQTKNVATTTPNIINRSHVRAMPSKSIIFPATGLLDGIFSVSATEKVRFSSGLLQAKYSTATSSYSFQIAESQLEFVGTTSGNTTINAQTDGALVDSFGWSSDAENNLWGINTSRANDDYKGNFVDWGTHESFNSLPFVLKTPSSSEFAYILNNRTCVFTINGSEPANNRYALVRIGNDDKALRGLLIFPDTFDWNTTTMGTIPSLFNAHPGSLDGWNENTYSMNQFEAMEGRGVVFMVAANNRYSSTIQGNNDQLRIWYSNKMNEDNARRLLMGQDKIYVENASTMEYGHGVRLVSPID